MLAVGCAINTDKLAEEKWYYSWKNVRKKTVAIRLSE